MSCWPESRPSNGQTNDKTTVYELVKKAAAEHLASPEASMYILVVNMPSC